MSKEFSIIMPIRDTPQERQYAIMSLPAAVALGPAELILGLDHPVSDDFNQYLKHILLPYCAQFVSVTKTSDWNMPLAHVLDSCINAARYDKILITNVDVLLQPAILGGYDLLSEQTPCITYVNRMLIKTPRQALKWVWCRLSHYRVGPSWSGDFWLHRDAYRHISITQLQAIHNVIDTFIQDKIERNDKMLLAQNKIGSHSMDIGNPDLPWRQFQAGIWEAMHTNRTDMRIRARSFILNRPYLHKGWIWAKNNPEHPVCATAKQQDAITWVCNGSTLIHGVLDWDTIGKTGTGY